MKYSVTCSCGQILPVEATQAGSTLTCRCQQTVKVPRLSVLRLAAGESAIPLNAAERVRQAVSNGALPDNDLCPITGRVPDAIAVFRIHCEKVWQQSTGDASTLQYIFWFLVLGWIGIVIAMLRGKRDAEQRGRDTYVDAPLRVSAEVLKRLSKERNQYSLRELLSSTTHYAELFAAYPEAEITFHSGTN
jgi:hypothetical protein